MPAVALATLGASASAGMVLTHSVSSFRRVKRHFQVIYLLHCCDTLWGSDDNVCSHMDAINNYVLIHHMNPSDLWREPLRIHWWKCVSISRVNKLYWMMLPETCVCFGYNASVFWWCNAKLCIPHHYSTSDWGILHYIQFREMFIWYVLN